MMDKKMETLFLVFRRARLLTEKVFASWEEASKWLQRWHLAWQGSGGRWNFQGTTRINRLYTDVH